MRFKSRSRALVGSALAASIGLAGLTMAATPANAEPAEIIRIAGATRYGTAAEAAVTAYPSGATNVVLASGEAFPDALSAGGYAGSLDAPILLTPQGSVAEETLAALGELEADNVHVGPSDFVPWLTDRKWAHIRVEGTTFGGAPLNVELKLEVWDSPNSAGVVIDAVRCAKLGLDRGLAGPLLGPSSYFMKSPPEQYTDHEARQRTLAFIDGDPAVSATSARSARRLAS